MSEEKEITAKFFVSELTSSWSEDVQPASEAARISIGARTDLGCVRENNEDKYEFFLPASPRTLAAKGLLLAVADGMGGHAAGQVASELALKTLIDEYYGNTHPDVEGTLRSSISEANTVVHNAAGIGGREGMGCTLTVAVIRGREIFVAQVGDSRLYRLRGDRLEQITQDHSWVADQVRMGVMTEDEAELSPFRNIITRSIGTQSQVEADIYRLDAQEGDILMLCSDGLSGVVSSADIEATLRQMGPAEATQRLVGLALKGGGPDNVTVLTAKIESFYPLDLKDDGEETVLSSGNEPEAILSAEPAQPESDSKKKGLLSRLFDRQ